MVMKDIIFSVDGSDGKVIDMIYYPDSMKLFIWVDKERQPKPAELDVNYEDMVKAKEDFCQIFNGNGNDEYVKNAWMKFSELLSPCIVEFYKNKDKDDKDKDKKTKLQVAFETVKQQARNLFIDEYSTPYIAIPIADHLEIFPVNSHLFKNWYRMFIFERDGTILDNQTVNDLCSLASAYAASSKYGAQINLGLRTASNDSNNNSFGRLEWYYDLSNKSWEFVKITSNGWELVKDQIIFRRYNNQQAQAYPDRYYQPDIFDRFFKLVNIKADDKDSILLLKCYIISLFIPGIQKVILILYGSQGAAKSSLQELIKMLVDPSVIMTLTFPRDLNELIQQLSHNYVTYYDNISVIKPWISDQLCRAVSGSGSSKRQLFTDDDDIIRSFKRCIGINGINLAATKPDLLDRSIITKLEEIEEGKRRTPEDIWKEFEEIRPLLLGYIFDILVKVLNYEEINPAQKFKLYRMTEFSKYGEIIARCLGYPDDEFIKVYERNRVIQVDEIIESSQVATCLMYMMYIKYGDTEGDNRPEWDGTASALLREFRTITDLDMAVTDLNIDTKSKDWPKKANVLRRRLNELAPTLKEVGLKITFYKEKDRNRTKKIRIRKLSSASSVSSVSEKSCSQAAENADDTVDDSGTHSTISSANIGQNRAQSASADDMDDMDDTLHVIKEAINYDYDCYECIERKKKRFRTNDQTEYENHFKQNHKGKTAYPGKADLELYGWRAQGKPWEK